MKTNSNVGRWTLGVAVAAAACTSEPDRVPFAPMAKASVDIQTLSYKLRSAESAFAELSRQVPSSAGFFYDDKGVLTITLVDTVQAEAAILLTRTFVANKIIGAVDGSSRIPEVRIVEGRFRFDQLAAWRDIVTENMLGRFGVVSSDLNESANRVGVGIDTKQAGEARTFVERSARESGIPLEALMIFLEEPKRQERNPVCDTQSGTLRERQRPLVGGLAIRWNTGSCGTLGVPATVGSTRFIVTNSHLTASFLAMGSPPRVFSQGDSVAYRIGVESSDPDCYLLPLFCRFADAALIGIDDSVATEIGAIARTTYRNNGAGDANSGSIVIDPVHPTFWIEAYAGWNIVQGQTVNKMGARTGWTWGVVVPGGTCKDMTPLGETKKLGCQFEANYAHDGGDSGAPVFYWTGGNTVVLAGIHWGGAFSAYKGLEQDLGVLQVRYPVGVPEISGSIASGFPEISWSATTNAQYYRVFRCVDPEAGPNCYMGDEDLGTTTSTTFIDTGAPTIDGYSGGGVPTGPRIRYTVKAYGNDVASASSNIIWYSYTPWWP